MLILLIILLFVTLYGIKISSFHSDYMSLHSTNAIKGFFAVLILYSHMRQYLPLTDTFANNSYLEILKYIGQMMVTMYLFYSGYGLMESQRKKPDYKKNFLRNRFLKILLHFNIAVLFYILLQLILGKYFSITEYLGSMIGWHSVGNSNWFIFVILTLYLIFFLSLCVGQWSKKWSKKEEVSEYIILFVVFVSCILLWYGLYRTKGQSWWINNIMVFPLSISFSIFKSQIEEWIKKGYNYYIAFLLLTAFLISWHSSVGIDKKGICTCIFALWTVLLSMKVKFDNKILQWLGTLAFSIYILQRLPMIALAKAGINQDVWLFVTIVIPSVLITAYLYNHFLSKMDKFLWRKNYSIS